MKHAFNETFMLMKYNWEVCTDQLFTFTYYFKEFNQCFRDWQFWMTREDVHKFNYHSWRCHLGKLGRYGPFWTTVNQGAFDMFEEFYWDIYNV